MNAGDKLSGFLGAGLFQMHKDHIEGALLIVALLCLLGLTAFTKVGFAVLITVWASAAAFVVAVLLVGRRKASN